MGIEYKLLFHLLARLNPESVPFMLMTMRAYESGFPVEDVGRREIIEIDGVKYNVKPLGSLWKAISTFGR